MEKIKKDTSGANYGYKVKSGCIFSFFKGYPQRMRL